VWVLPGRNEFVQNFACRIFSLAAFLISISRIRWEVGAANRAPHFASPRVRFGLQLVARLRSLAFVAEFLF
jgi:hypothetical protein